METKARTKNRKKIDLAQSSRLWRSTYTIPPKRCIENEQDEGFEVAYKPEYAPEVFSYTKQKDFSPIKTVFKCRELVNAVNFSCEDAEELLNFDSSDQYNSHLESQKYPPEPDSTYLFEGLTQQAQSLPKLDLNNLTEEFKIEPKSQKDLPTIHQNNLVRNFKFEIEEQYPFGYLYWENIFHEIPYGYGFEICTRRLWQNEFYMFFSRCLSKGWISQDLNDNSPWSEKATLEDYDVHKWIKELRREVKYKGPSPWSVLEQFQQNLDVNNTFNLQKILLAYVLENNEKPQIERRKVDNKTQIQEEKLCVGHPPQRTRTTSASSKLEVRPVFPLVNRKVVEIEQPALKNGVEIVPPKKRKHRSPLDKKEAMKITFKNKVDNKIGRSTEFKCENFPTLQSTQFVDKSRIHKDEERIYPIPSEGGLETYASKLKKPSKSLPTISIPYERTIQSYAETYVYEPRPRERVFFRTDVTQKIEEERQLIKRQSFRYPRSHKTEKNVSIFEYRFSPGKPTKVYPNKTYKPYSNNTRKSYKLPRCSSCRTFELSPSKFVATEPSYMFTDCDMAFEISNCNTSEVSPCKSSGRLSHISLNTTSDKKTKFDTAFFKASPDTSFQVSSTKIADKITKSDTALQSKKEEKKRRKKNKAKSRRDTPERSREEKKVKDKKRRFREICKPRKKKIIVTDNVVCNLLYSFLLLLFRLSRFLFRQCQYV